MVFTLQDHVRVSCEQLRAAPSTLSPRERAALEALTTSDCHSVDVVRQLIEAGVSQASEFAWLSQLRSVLRREEGASFDVLCACRFYAGGEEGLQARLMYASLDYGWEFLGPTPALVITPLTLRCYRALVAAYQMGVGTCLQVR